LGSRSDLKVSYSTVLETQYKTANIRSLPSTSCWP